PFSTYRRMRAAECRTSGPYRRMTVTIGRRELLAALGGAAAAWPLAVRAGFAQTVGYLTGALQLRTHIPNASMLRSGRFRTTKTHCRSRVRQNAVMHTTRFFNDVVGCYPSLQESTGRRREFGAAGVAACRAPLARELAYET